MSDNKIQSQNNEDNKNNTTNQNECPLVILKNENTNLGDELNRINNVITKLKSQIAKNEQEKGLLISNYNKKDKNVQEIIKNLKDANTQLNALKNKELEIQSENSLNIKALKLRDIAKESLSSNKIFDELVSFIPFAGSALKKFVIKKNAVKKVEQIFGIDVELLVKDTHASYEDYSYEELLDKFVDYYKNMAERNSNIFKSGLDYFLMNNAN